MRIKPCTKNDIPDSKVYSPRQAHRPRKSQLRAFLESGDEAWEIGDDEIEPHSVYSALRTSAQKYREFRMNLEVIKRGNRVFIVRL